MSLILGARNSFNEVDQIAKRFANVSHPLELALPYRYVDWLAAGNRFDEMLADLDKSGSVIVSVHATQAPLEAPAFLEWGRRTLDVARHFGAKAITVHPNMVRKWYRDAQYMALRHLRQLSRQAGDIQVSVETFSGAHRVFKPKDVIDFGLPMTLDTSHLHVDEEVMHIIENYWEHIPVVHLSARRNGEQHLPVYEDEFCARVFRTLRKLAEAGSWNGVCILEYLREYHDLYDRDIEWLLNLA
jgi:sugar phosphate isomerase/epimerase